jgi:hypothetical protein
MLMMLTDGVFVRVVIPCCPQLEPVLHVRLLSNTALAVAPCGQLLLFSQVFSH